MALGGLKSLWLFLPSVPAHGRSATREIQTCPQWLFFSCKLYFSCGRFPLAEQQLCRMEDASVLAWLGLSLENGCPYQKSFFCQNLFMSFALCPHLSLCKCQSRLEVSAQINSLCRKKLSLSFFFPLSSAFTTSFFTKECWLFPFSL